MCGRPVERFDVVKICVLTRGGDKSAVYQARSESSPILLQSVLVPFLYAKPRGIHGIGGKRAVFCSPNT